MKWTVEVQRIGLDRRNFEDLLAGLGFSLIDGVQYPALWSPEMVQCNTAAEAFELAKKVRGAFAGPSQVDPEFTLGSVVDYTFSPARRHAFLEAQCCVSMAMVGTVTISVGTPTGLSAAELEAWQKNRVEQECQTKL